MYDKTSSGIETPGTNDAATLTNGWNYNTEIESLDTHKPSTHCLDLWAASPLEHIEGPFESRRLHRQTAIDPKAIQKSSRCSLHGPNVRQSIKEMEASYERPPTTLHRSQRYGT